MKKKQNTSFVNLKGVSKSLLEKVKKLSGFDLINHNFKLLPSHLSLFKLGSFYHFEKGLAEFSGPEFPKLVAKAVEKLLGIRHIYTIGINKSEKLFATIHFFNRSKNPITDNEYIESFVRQAGIVIERKHAEEQLQQNEIELRETSATKDKFFSIISHDLRSPFASIVNLLGLMAENSKDFSPAEFNQFAQSAHKTAQSTFHLLENLLEWSRLQRGVLPYNPEKINLKDFVKTCDPSTFEMAKEKKIKIDFNFPKGLIIKAD
nr:hypothetical protein [Prolixibacteraceae bacterium]